MANKMIVTAAQLRVDDRILDAREQVLWTITRVTFRIDTPYVAIEHVDGKGIKGQGRHLESNRMLIERDPEEPEFT
jgi:hypothetical protein